MNRNTAILYFYKLRELIAENLTADAPDLTAWEIEVDESYFGGAKKEKRDRGTAGKIPIFGLLKRGGNVYAVTIPYARSETLIPVIKSKIRADSIVYTDGFRAYDVPDVSDFHHVRINHYKLFAEDRNHINGSRTSGTKPNAICDAKMASQGTISILKECEWASITGQPLSC